MSLPSFFTLENALYLYVALEILLLALGAIFVIWSTKLKSPSKSRLYLIIGIIFFGVVAITLLTAITLLALNKIP